MQVLHVAAEEYLGWLCNTKMLLLVFLFVYLKGQISDVLLVLTDISGAPLQWFEPGIALLNSRYVMMVLPFLYLTLMSAFPKNDGNSLFFVSRTGKFSWLAGQILTAVYSAATLTMASVAAVTLPCIGKIQWNGGNWSDAVTKYYVESPDFKFSLVTGRIYNHMQPGEAFFHSVCLAFLCLLLVSAVQLLSAVWGKKTAGLVAASGLTAVGGVLSLMESGKFMWYFPTANTQIWLRHDMIVRDQTVPLGTSYMYFIVLTAVLFVAAWAVFRKRSFQG